MSNSSSVDYFMVAYTDPSHIFISVITSILVLIILVGNVLTLCAITKFRNLRHQSSIMIGALAMVDLWMGVVYTPMNLIRAHMPRLFDREGPCYVIIYVGHFAAITAVTYLSLLSLERFYAVQFPYHYHAHSGIKSAVTVNVAVFSVIAISLIPVFAGAANWHEGARCYGPALYPKSYNTFLIIMVLILTVSGFAAFVRVSIMEFKFRKQTSDQSIGTIRKQESIRTKLMLTAYLVSLCFWMPHLIYYFYDSISKGERNMYLFRVMSLFDLGSSAVNCFLYAWKNSKFRAAYKELLHLNSSSELQHPHADETET